MRDLSELRFMVGTSAELVVAKNISDRLPQADLINPRIIWDQDSLFGCMFLFLSMSRITNPENSQTIQARRPATPVSKANRIASCKPWPPINTNVSRFPVSHCGRDTPIINEL